MYPGKEGVCVYVGQSLTAESIIEALEEGRFFSMRAPGAFVNMTVDGVPMGGTVCRGGQPMEACIAARGSRSIRRIELVADGAVVEAVEPSGAREVDLRLQIPDGARWVVARIKLDGGEWDSSTHSFTPLMVAGYDAFTNPVFIAEKQN